MTANPPGAATAAPGQAEAARLAYFERRGAAHLIDPWNEITELDARSWEAAAQAAIAAGNAEPPATRIGPCPVGSHDAEHLQVRTGDAWLCGELLAQLLAANDIYAPGLGTAWRLLDEARAELGRLRERFENLAAGMAMSAAMTRPSKKSEIEAGCSEAIRGILASAAPDAAAGQDGS